MSTMPKFRQSITLDPDLASALRARAELERRSVSNLVEVIVHEYLTTPTDAQRFAIREAARAGAEHARLEGSWTRSEEAMYEDGLQEAAELVEGDDEIAEDTRRVLAGIYVSEYSRLKDLS